jgi:hypothetical protein
MATRQSLGNIPVFRLSYRFLSARLTRRYNLVLTGISYQFPSPYLGIVLHINMFGKTFDIARKKQYFFMSRVVAIYKETTCALGHVEI